MTQWYYADAQRQRQGPVDTDTLRARLTQGIIDRSSLVWREGLAQWVALHEVGAELGLDSAASAAPGSARSTPADALIDAPLPAAYPGGSASATAPPAATSPLHDHVPETSPWQPAAAGGGITASASDAAATDRTNHHPAVDSPLHPPHEQAPTSDASAWSTAPADTATTPLTSGPSLAKTADATSPPGYTPAAATTPLPGAWDAPAFAAPAASVALQDAPVVYAGLWRRVAASILDSLITTFAVYLIVIPLVFVVALITTRGDSGSALDDGSALGIAIVVMSYGIGLAIPTLYFAWMQSSRHQASLGKLACGIKLVRADSNGGRVGFWRNVLRYLAYMLISVLTLGIGAIVAAFMAGMTERKQAPHDKVCDTLVVDRWAFTEYPERQSRGLDTVSIVVLAIYAVILVLSVVVVAFMLAAIRMSQS
ncbi:RDD family protein [Xanthomonas vasicola]|uniref:RDD family protein n=1 Tax=Xanthomonas vasicola TaxID=56459 RepID=UPI000346344C|nr:RDD family protein [Xanthomonas vasicola]KFA31772.1 RDD family protein [Xanthomonas vasicola pv. vasculorum NCPPB 1326]KFA36355.1 RDD family protein [Xanthomonas vasicola pv. vasculorum NCPPB 1381]KFA37661.1 RDD family protein [Xanthomonas vasicola pv. vasculorum NCPPB 206]MBV6748016.1 RDD family protein [Xanthomonas vasicola pv. vasculorum NCPPB 890]MBV6893562.1 RDD family protein [Xanthomonas vasicola pv. vasculorum]